MHGKFGIEVLKKGLYGFFAISFDDCYPRLFDVIRRKASWSEDEKDLGEMGRSTYVNSWSEDEKDLGEMGRSTTVMIPN
ncbi:hypothetical protein KFK09_004648 [Dendrobium nobile]|uniref:Uncharacterized protein n=1 Tax=Dendrobium nobile TaxID=94219 RepID=A0A8T3C622_DENNO|nr:hypothetical protein KFK09_004648 [Dendrobium nobile]